jgi:hypothetical protein
MVRAAAPLGAARSGSAPRKSTVPNWVVVGLISIYCMGLADGLLMYQSIGAAPVQTTTAATSEKQQIGRLLILTPNGCQSGAFDNSKPTFAVSQMPCDQVMEKVEPDASSKASGEVRIKAIGRYFRGTN